MMIEQNTNYAYKIKYMGNPTFDKVRDLSTKFYLELPQELKDELYEALHRGIDILDSEPQMTAYIFAYGKMHQAKLNYAFDKLSDNFFEQEEINIVDYGCGQAIGTMCYADFLRKNHYLQKVKTITLIEPSEICLKRAALHTSAFFPESEIKTVNKGFNDLNENDIICSEKTPTLHILSNVLDILNFDIYNFAELIKNNLKGKNQFVCVAPYYNGKEKDNRMDLFASKINGSNIITRKYKANEFIPEKEWTCKISCFKKNIGSFEMIKDSGLKQHTIYYEADKKIESERWNRDVVWVFSNWIDKNSISHNFSNGKGKIRLKNGVNEIGVKAFSGCSGLISINIPNSVTKIDMSAFSGCSGLTSINIPDSVTVIGGWAFSGCSGLTSINIPDSVTGIGYSAFSGCSGLTSLTIGNGVTIVNHAFYGCSGLTSIVVVSGNGKYDSRNNCNAIIETAKNTLVTGCMNTVIPDSVTEIGESAFDGCSGLTSISIPDSVTKIGDRAFDGCRNIMYNGKAKGKPWGALTVNGHVDGYLVYADESKSVLTGCSTLATEAVIPDSVTGIGEFAFYRCSGLTSINIPNSVKVIGKHAFEGCSGLTSINIPNSVKVIGDYAFYGCSGLTSINIPDSVKVIGVSAFKGCEKLTKESVNKIGKINLLGLY